MEDFIGFLVFILFAAISVVGRISKQKSEREQESAPPKWPGPVANPPREARFPRPSGPSPAPKPAQPRAPRSSSEDVSMEGVRTEGFGSASQGWASEGPAGVDSVAAERARFRRESEQFSQPHRKEQVGALARTGAAAQEQAQDNPLVIILADQAQAAQAIVLAEVLGKPRALRRR